jgi:nucleoside 2-deoxyribosyltransferase
MQVLYLCGPISCGNTASPAQVEAHIQAFALPARELWNAGFAVISPAHNTIWHWMLGGGCTHDVYMRGDLALLSRCDAAIFLPAWLDSAGAREEREFCIREGIPIYDWPDRPKR